MGEIKYELVTKAEENRGEDELFKAWETHDCRAGEKDGCPTCALMGFYPENNN